MSILPSVSTVSMPVDDASQPVEAVLTTRFVMLAGSCIVVLPNILFAIHLRLLPATILSVGAIGGIAMLGRRRTLGRDAILARALDFRRLGICLALSLGIMVLGGEAHLVFTNWDWLWRDAVLADVARAPFPPIYRVDNQDFFLRAPLGMYLLPALVAKAVDLSAGHAALLVQNALFLALILYMLATLAGRRAALVVFVFLSFSGLDVIGQLYVWLHQGNGVASFTLPSHIEWWAPFQYSSVITQIFWVPNHALPAYWLVVVVLLAVRREIGVGDLGFVIAGSLFWSPFAVIGTLPFAAYLFVRDARQLIVTPRFWLAVVAAGAILPVALFMQTDAQKVPHDFILFMPSVASTIVLFLLIEIPHVAIIGGTWPALDPKLKAVVGVSIIVLVVLPSERFGVSNDLVMRASIPALTILSIAFADALAIAWTTRPSLFAVGASLLFLGAVTPAMEIIRSLSFASFAVSDCNLVTVWKKLEPQQPTLDNYLARRSELTNALIGVVAAVPLVDRPSTVCWPDIPFDPRLSTARLSNATLTLDAKAPHPQR